MKTNALDTSLWHAILSSGPLVQLILGLLVLMSIVSWTIILAKWFQWYQLQAANHNFLQQLGKYNALNEIHKLAKAHQVGSSMARLYSALFEAYQDLEQQRNQNIGSEIGAVDKEYIDSCLDREIHRSIRNELGALESRLTWLASTGSSAPFIGLLGTVWGLLSSFQKIGAMGSASLAVVAPGISEALVATAVGLLAAIPATLFYNHFINKIRENEIELQDLALDFATLIKRQLGK